jgi:hypothetical protein
MLEPRSSLRELGRFSEPGLLILVSLADGPKHGYADRRDVPPPAQAPLPPDRDWRNGPPL